MSDWSSYEEYIVDGYLDLSKIIFEESIYKNDKKDSKEEE